MTADEACFHNDKTIVKTKSIKEQHSDTGMLDPTRKEGVQYDSLRLERQRTLDLRDVVLQFRVTSEPVGGSLEDLLGGVENRAYVALDHRVLCARNIIRICDEQIGINGNVLMD